MFSPAMTDTDVVMVKTFDYLNDKVQIGYLLGNLSLFLIFGIWYFKNTNSSLFSVTMELKATLHRSI